jgi:hypothetical protein
MAEGFVQKLHRVTGSRAVPKSKESTLPLFYK